MNSGTYKHRQKGVLQPVLLTVAAVCFGIGILLKDTPPYLVIFMETAIACAALSFAMVYLAVEDKGEYLLIRFGPLPLFRKKIPYENVTGIDKGRSNFWSGWGIHPTKKGWLWNIGGFDYVRVEMSGKATLIGTDDPNGLMRFLQSKCRPVQPKISRKIKT